VIYLKLGRKKWNSSLVFNIFMHFKIIMVAMIFCALLIEYWINKILYLSESRHSFRIVSMCVCVFVYPLLPSKTTTKHTNYQLITIVEALWKRQKQQQLRVSHVACIINNNEEIICCIFFIAIHPVILFFPSSLSFQWKLNRN
jgi:hypothetical protein